MQNCKVSIWYEFKFIENDFSLVLSLVDSIEIQTILCFDRIPDLQGSMSDFPDPIAGILTQHWCESFQSMVLVDWTSQSDD